MISRYIPRPSIRHGAGLKNKRGIALVLVLWMLMLLTLIANGVALTARTEAQIAGNLFALAQAEAVADAAIHKAMAELMVPAGGSGYWRSDGLEIPWLFDSANVRVTIRDEAAKVDLNTAPAVLLSGLFRAVGVSPMDAETLADAVIDWRDPDELRSLHGAERPEYAAVGRPYGPANAPFDSVEELRLVLGVNEDIFRAVSRYVTVFSQSGVVNAAVAERPVLLALPGATPEQVDSFLERRRLALERGLPPPQFALALGSTGPGAAFYSIRAEANLGDNAHFSREAVVRLTGNPSKPFVILAWRAPMVRIQRAADILASP